MGLKELSNKKTPHAQTPTPRAHTREKPRAPPRRTPQRRSMILRVRTKAGTWRLEVEGPQTTVLAVKQLIEQQKNVQAAQQTLSKDPKGDKPLDDAATLQQCRLGDNGAMVHLIVGEAVALPRRPRKKIEVLKEQLESK